MNTAQTSSRFRTTSWTLIRRARANPADLGELLRRYWSPAYAFLRRSGWRREEAQDLTQGFMAEVMLGRDLIGPADPKLGRFRSYLLTSLRRYAIDWRRRNGNRERLEKIHLPDDPDELEHAEPRESDDPGTAFDRQWATAVFDMALKQTEASCREEGMTRQWRAFEARVKQPNLHGCDPVPVEQLIEELDARNAQEIYDLVNTVKRKLRQAIREVVAETVEPCEVDQELSDLRRWLSA